jgi:hypothetical protein
MASARGMPGSHIPTCPAALQLVYYRQGWRHEIFIAFDIQGNRVVGLQIGRQWSGWHGQWDPWDLGGIVICYTGLPDRARPHFLERVMPRMYELQQSRQIRVFASRVTRHMLSACRGRPFGGRGLPTILRRDGSRGKTFPIPRTWHQLQQRCSANSHWMEPASVSTSVSSAPSSTPASSSVPADRV